MLNRRNYTRNGHEWNPMPDMELESLRGGSYFWKGGSRKGGFGRTHRTPPGYGPDQQGRVGVQRPGRMTLDI